MKKYVYIPPEEMPFEDMMEEFIPNYDQLDESTKQKTLQVYAYNCFGSPYFLAPTHCPEGV
jgi:hypothetical protein